VDPSTLEDIETIASRFGIDPDRLAGIVQEVREWPR
jgi:hypothetical protein